MAIFKIDESDTRFNPKAAVIPRKELKLGETLELRRKTSRTDVPEGATEFIGNNLGPDGADVDIYGIRLRKDDEIKIAVKDVNDEDSVNHRVRIFSGKASNKDHIKSSRANSFPFTAPRTGTYFIAVSARGNNSYDPDHILYNSEDSGSRIVPPGNNTGAFELELTLEKVGPPTPPVFSVDSVIIEEGTLPGFNQVVFTISLDRPDDVPAKVESVVVKTVNGTAIAEGDAIPEGNAPSGNDYTSLAPTTLTFQPTQTTHTATINITPDALAELDETFFLELMPQGDAIAPDNRGEAILLNDDYPRFLVDDIIVQEGTAPDENHAIFNVRLSSASAVTEKVIVKTVDGTAIAGEDYTAILPTTLEFAPFDTTPKPVRVPIRPDSLVELDETFFLELIPDGNGRVLVDDPQGQAIIRNDDYPEFSVNDVMVVEGTGSDSNSLVFTVSLSEPSLFTHSVEVFTTDGSAIANQDYSFISSTLTFIPGQTSQDVRIPVTADNIVELDETVFLNLRNPTGGATIRDGQGQGLIKNDDTAYITILPAPPTLEGDSGTTPANFTVTLTNPVDIPVSVDYNSADGTATLANNDYQPAQGTITFPSNPGVTSQTIPISVNIVGDLDVERDENFSVNLSNLQASSRDVVITTPSATGTILNDDIPKVSLSIIDSPFPEDGGQATVIATLDRPHPFQEVVVDLGFTGEAQLGIDYTPSAQTITIPANELTGSITLTGLDDDIVETDEDVIVDIVGVNGAMKDGGPVQGIIWDDVDDKATVSISDAMVVEGNDGTTPMIFTITTDTLSSRDIVATVVTSPITATPGEDYIGIDGIQQVIIPAGESSTELSIPVIGDTIAEPDEFFGVIITGADIPEIPGRAMIGDRLGVGTIKNDDLPNVTLSVDVDAIAENGGQAIITASLDIPALSIFNGVPIDDVIVELEFGGDATFGTDYSADPLTITIPRGETVGSNTVEITAIDDFIDEMDGEAIAVGIKSLTNANERVDQQLSITIIDDDTAGVTLMETDGNTAVTEGGNNDTYTLVLDSQPTADVTIALTPDEQITLGQSTLTFTSANWNVPQTVTVKAVDDVELEGDHTGLITHTITSADPKYDALSVPDVTVAITDVYNVMFIANRKEENLSKLDRGFLARTKAGILEIANARDASEVVNIEVFKDTDLSGLDMSRINQQDLVVISESTLSSNAKGIFTDVQAGVLTWEPFLYSDLGMTDSTIGTDFDYTCHRDRTADCGTREIDIINAGQSERQAVYNAPPADPDNPNATVPLNPHISWGLVNPDQANIIAALPGEIIPDSNDGRIRATIFSYEKGDRMTSGMIADGKRMGFFAHNLDHEYTDLTDVGKTLFSDAIVKMVG